MKRKQGIILFVMIQIFIFSEGVKAQTVYLKGPKAL